MKVRLDLNVAREIRSIATSKKPGGLKVGEICRMTAIIERRTYFANPFTWLKVTVGRLIHGLGFYPRIWLKTVERGMCEPTLFEEIEDSPLMRVVSSVKKEYPIKVVTRFNGPKTMLFCVASEPVAIGKKMLEELEVGDVITVGRHGDICLNSRGEAFSNYVSRLHCFVYRESVDGYVLVSCSPNSTSLF